jgi:hypothetical protein
MLFPIEIYEVPSVAESACNESTVIVSASKVSMCEDVAFTGCPEESDESSRFPSGVFVTSAVGVGVMVGVSVLVQVRVMVEVTPMVGDGVMVAVGIVVFVLVIVRVDVGV